MPLELARRSEFEDPCTELHTV